MCRRSLGYPGGVEPHNRLSGEELEFTELRTLNLLAALLGFILPMLGLLGACVYVFREIDRRIQTSTWRRGRASTVPCACCWAPP